MTLSADRPGAVLGGFVLAIVVLGGSGATAPARAARREAPPLVRLRDVCPGVRVDLRYATADNVFRRRLYDGTIAMLRAPVARRLARVQDHLARQGLGLKVWDAYRPYHVQGIMWRIRPGTRYLSNPRRGSKHNRGAAVDVTLVDRAGAELPMPTPFDEFSPRAHRGATRGVSPERQKNSRTLEAAMRAEGFFPNRWEWWHFTASDWQRYPLADVPVPRE